MADTYSVSDTQVLLQSMLQRLKLQPKSENTHMQDEVPFGGTSIKQNSRASESPPQTPTTYKMDNKSIVTNQAAAPSQDSTGASTSLSQEFAQGITVRNSRPQHRPKQRALSWDYKSHRITVPSSGENPDIGTQANDGVMTEQNRQRKLSLINKSQSSVSSLQSPERLSPWTQVSDQDQSNIRNQEPEQRKWTQKVKEKWKERHKSSIKKDDSERLEQTLSNSNSCLISVQNGISRTTTFNEEVNIQQQPISNGSVQDIPSLLDHMSETLFTPGSFNLMEEIFTAQEWARYLPSSTDSQSASGSITHHPEIGLGQNDQNMFSRRDYREKADTSVRITHTPMNSGGFHIIDTSENTFNLRKTQSFAQYRPSESGSRHWESMDLSGTIHPYHHSNNTQTKVTSSSSSEHVQHVHNQSRTMEINQIMDVSYLQPKDSSGLNKQILPGRKRSHSTERRNANDRWRWRNGSASSTSDPAPSLSPASSTSSLQYYQDLESSVATETVIKKRRVENTRHVRFAEEVTVVPPLILSDDEVEAEDDEDYAQNGNMIHEENEECEKESVSQAYVPRWIEALRSKTKKPKLKLPRMRTKKYSFM